MVPFRIWLCILIGLSVFANIRMSIDLDPSKGLVEESLMFLEDHQVGTSQKTMADGGRSQPPPKPLVENAHQKKLERSDGRTNSNNWNANLGKVKPEADKEVVGLPIGLPIQVTPNVKRKRRRKDMIIRESTTAKPNSDLEDFKKILFFTKFWNKSDVRFGLGHQPFVDANCPVSSCVTESRLQPNGTFYDFGDYDAVIFTINAQDLKLSKELINRTSEWRRPHQKFIMLGYENPSWVVDWFGDLNGFFNWTMTYRWDSDVPLPYGWFTLRQKDSLIPPKPLLNVQAPPDKWIPYDDQHFVAHFLPNNRKELMALAKRPKKVAWIVSNCKHSSTMRLEYVQELSKYIQVDLFGGSHSPGTVVCPTSMPCNGVLSDRRADNCTLAVERDYKFYLSFENTFCNDYTSEKLYRRMNKSVTISLSQTNLTKIVPPHSTISVFEFESPKALADYLHYLDRNDTAYLSYFWWKEHYDVHSRFRFDPGFCNLCSKLHSNQAVSQSTTYENIVDWWQTSAECGKKNLEIQSMLDPNIVQQVRKEQNAAIERVNQKRKMERNQMIQQKTDAKVH